MSRRFRTVSAVVRRKLRLGRAGRPVFYFLVSRRSRQARSTVLMVPGMPLALFAAAHCIVREHPPASGNILPGSALSGSFGYVAIQQASAA
jgi:hypothetical protein